MPPPALDRSAAGDSLVGTLLALGVLLAMLMAGVALIASTQGDAPEPVADIRVGPIRFDPCPAEVTPAAGSDGTVRCARVPVVNTGEEEGLVRCTLTDGIRGTARFDVSGMNVGSIDLAAGGTGELLVLIEGAQDLTLPIVECASVPLLPA